MEVMLPSVTSITPYQVMTLKAQIVTMVLGLVTVATSMSLGLVVVVSLGLLNVLIVIGGFLKMSLMDRMTPTRVVTRIAVPRMDLGVTPLTLKFDGNTAMCLDVLQEFLKRPLPFFKATL